MKILFDLLRPKGLEKQTITFDHFYGNCKDVYRYEKVCRIGEGTYGIVYKAKLNTSSSEKENFFALKRIRMEQESNGIPLHSIRELEILKSLKHENIVSVHEIVVGDSLDALFLVMEFCLYDMAYLMDVKRHYWKLKEIKCLLKQLIQGAMYLHQNSIIHRDLKLSNLLITEQGVLKIADFGISRAFSHERDLQMTPNVVTLWYRAPELILGQPDYGPEVDVWSIGCIFGEWLRNSALFPGDSEQKQLTLIEECLGSPSPKIWPGLLNLPLTHLYKFLDRPFNSLRHFIPESHSDNCVDFLNQFLTYCPVKRITCSEALDHSFFRESPLPCSFDRLSFPPSS